MKMDKSMSNIMTKTVILGPLIKRKRLNNDPNNPKIVDFQPYVHFQRFSIQNFERFSLFSILQLYKFSCQAQAKPKPNWAEWA